jgi:tricorn protease
MLNGKQFCACLLALVTLVALAPVARVRAQSVSQNQPAPRPYFYEPTISPDRSEIAFVSGGDIWTVRAEGGEARLLVSHSANESRPLYSADGRRLAFVSNRTGNGDLYVLTFETGDLKRLTFDDTFEQLDAWSADGRWLYFSTSARDISGTQDIYRVSVEGGTPMLVSADRYATEYGGAPSPDGAHLALVGRGFGQWWRHGSSHIDHSEIWLMRDHSTAGYEKVSEGGARDAWPMWSRDGRTIYYTSDRGGAENLWRVAPGGRPAQVTRFTDGRLLWPSISADGRAIVFERNLGIWKLDTESGRAAEVRITRRGSAANAAAERLRQTDQLDDLALAPDGKKVAFVARGEVFAASATDGGDATRVTTTPAPESQPAWAPDSRRLAYVSERNGPGQLFLYDFATNAETQLTTATQGDDTPRFSPDGKMIAFLRGGRELRVLDVEKKEERVVAAGAFWRPPLNSDRPFVWSPDNRWLAYMPSGQKLFRNAHVARVDGSEPPRPVSFLANVFNNTISWSPDGAYLLFDTGQRTESSQLARVDLQPRLPRFREDQFRELFRDEPRTAPPTRPRPDTVPQPTATPTPQAQPTPSPSPTPSPTPAAEKKGDKLTEVVFDGVRRRLSVVPVGVDVFYQTISPDGKWVLMVAGAVNQTNLYVYSLDELAREPAVTRQLTSTPGFKTSAQFTPDNREVFYIENGRIQIASMDPTRPPRALNVAAEMDVDFAREKFEVFEQGWEYLRDNFYDPGYHGADWPTLRGQYLPYIAGAQTADEMRRLMRLMVGELNASHLGVSGPAPPPAAQFTTGRLGLRFDRAEYERGGRLRVTEVLPLSPGALARDPSAPERTSGVKVGEYLLAVDGRALDARTNLDELLSYKINRRVTLTVAASAEGAGKRELDVRPVNLTTEKGLRYRQWVDEKRAYVARASGGRLGYVHMPDMSSNSLAQLYVDLDAENQSREGVVVDVRQNNGGFVNVYAIDVLARRSYLRMSPRGLGEAPGRTYLGQRALELPTVLVTDKHTLSDGEDFAEGFRSARLGRVVGEPTAGWIIYTSGVTLLDGTVLRLPFVRVETADGVNMERNPRPVDVTVIRPIGETYTERDSQLDAAVRELLKQREVDSRQ